MLPKNKKTGTMQWRQRLNILSGTASDASGSNSFSADIHLVVYRVAKQITGIQLYHFLQEGGLNVLSCDLLTKYENASSLAYKISIRSCDYEKAQGPKIWPLRVGVWLFKYFKKRNLTTDGIEREGWFGLSSKSSTISKIWMINSVYFRIIQEALMQINNYSTLNC